MNNTIAAYPGECLMEFFLRAIKHAKDKNMCQRAEFNDVSIFVYPDSHYMDSMSKWELQRFYNLNKGRV